VTVLKQNTTGQAEIVSVIRQFRERHAPDPSVPRWESRHAAPRSYEGLVRRVEWKLIEMPLPRLQTMGQSQREFIYDIYWDQRIDRREVAAYQARQPSTFDNRVLLRPGVGEYLLQLSGLLRPLIQRRWAAMVAQLNRLEDSQLEMFLFGTDRTPTAKVRAGLWEIQDRRCFYCEGRVADPSHAHVDHFLPWSRYPDDGLDNFVIADKSCNGWKSNSLAASEHLARWARRFQEDPSDCSQLTELGAESGWDRGGSKTLSVARAIYLRLPKDARLWLRGKDFVEPDEDAIRAALSIESRRI
jgi:5-methylcytosine-specific restriction endonuclease McrA